MLYKKILLLSLSSVLVLSGCAQSVHSQDGSKNTMQTSVNSEIQPVSQEIFAMDTYMTVTAYGEKGAEAAEQAIVEIQRLDEMLSTGNSTSEIAVLNHSGKAILSEDAAYLIERSIDLSEKTNGVFDIAIYPVMEAWGFTTQNYRVPGSEELAELLKLTDISDLKYDSKSKEVSFENEGMKIDLGGIAKGYTSSRIVEIFKENGITSGMINLGGNVQVLGSKTDGSDWRVAIQSPENESDYLGILSIKDKAVITSGGYERYFEENGETYHHIIDPATGYPADSGLISVTIVSEDGTLADGLSTSLYIMGKNKAIEFWKGSGDAFDFILETEDKKLYVSEGIADDFETEQNMEVIKR